MKYKALISQQGTNNPIVKKLSRGLLDYTFERTSDGCYEAIPNIVTGKGCVATATLQAGENHLTKIGFNTVDFGNNPKLFTTYDGEQVDNILNNTYIEITPINEEFISIE